MARFWREPSCKLQTSKFSLSPHLEESRERKLSYDSYKGTNTIYEGATLMSYVKMFLSCKTVFTGTFTLSFFPLSLSCHPPLHCIYTHTSSHELTHRNRLRLPSHLCHIKHFCRSFCTAKSFSKDKHQAELRN